MNVRFHTQLSFCVCVAFCQLPARGCSVAPLSVKIDVGLIFYFCHIYLQGQINCYVPVTVGASRVLKLTPVGCPVSYICTSLFIEETID